MARPRATASAGPPSYSANGSSASTRSPACLSTSASLPAITAEAGGCGLVEESAVAAHARGLDGVLRYLDMLPPELAPAARPAPVYLDSFIWPRTPSAGWWEPAVRVGEAVTAGQQLGTVSTLDGSRVLETFSAPADGVVLFLTSSPAVAADGLLLGLGAGA